MISCQGEIEGEGECSKYLNEKYAEETTDTAMVKEAFEFQQILLERFRESSVKEMSHEAYQLQFHSSHGYGKSMKFEKKNDKYSLSVKCITKEDWYPDCKEYQISIEKEEWNELEKMIYEFNFWTEENFRKGGDVLDGYAFLLEGNRPEAAKCNKKTYKLIARGSPRYDKMGALCEYILEYEDQLVSRYEHMNKIK